MMQTFDHATLAVPDLAEARTRFADEFGLVCGPLRPTTAIGTRSRMIALPDSYLELVSVVDLERAQGDSFGSDVWERTRDGHDAWMQLCLADDAIEATAARLSTDVESFEREMSDGVVHRWRTVGLDDPRRTPAMPFFIQWDLPPGRHPGSAPRVHPVDIGPLACVEVEGDETSIRDWIGEVDLEVNVRPSESSRIVALTFECPAGRIHINDGQ